MSKIGEQTVSENSFNEHRDFVISDFQGNRSLYKRKMSQGAFWTLLDKDLANQYFRDEKWLFGFKIRDEIKLIDHGTGNIISKEVGFKKVVV